MKIKVTLWVPKSTLRADMLEYIAMFADVNADIEFDVSIKNEAKGKTTTKKSSGIGEDDDYDERPGRGNRLFGE